MNNGNVKMGLGIMKLGNLGILALMGGEECSIVLHIVLVCGHECTRC